LATIGTRTTSSNDKPLEREYKFFLFSKEQLKLRQDLEAKIGRKYKAGEIIIQGKTKMFTEISDTPTNPYQDAKVVAKGYTDEFRYTEPYVI